MLFRSQFNNSRWHAQSSFKKSGVIPFRVTDLRLRVSKSGRSGSRPHWIPDGVCGHKMVQGTRNHAEFQRVHKIHRHLVSRLYSRRNAVKSTNISREALFGSAEPHFGCTGNTIAGRPALYYKREGEELPAITPVQAEGPVA